MNVEFTWFPAPDGPEQEALCREYLEQTTALPWMLGRGTDLIVCTDTGYRRHSRMTPAERLDAATFEALLRVALHEAAHVLSAMKAGLPVGSVSVVASGDEAGHTDIGSKSQLLMLSAYTQGAALGDKSAQAFLHVKLRPHLTSTMAGTAVDLCLLEGHFGPEAAHVGRLEVRRRVCAVLGDRSVIVSHDRIDVSILPAIFEQVFQDRHDIKVAADMADCIAPSKARAASEIVMWSLKLVEAWVRRPEIWASIARLAQVLMARRTMTSDEVTPIALDLLAQAEDGAAA